MSEYEWAGGVLHKNYLKIKELKIKKKKTQQGLVVHTYNPRI